MEWNQHVLMILLTAVMLVSLLALCYAFTLYRSVRKEDAGNRTMQELSGLCLKLATLCQTDSTLSLSEHFHDASNSVIDTSRTVSRRTSIVITGIRQGDSLVNFLWDDGVYTTVSTPIAGASRPGTGDIFASILAADAVRGETLLSSVQKAANFVGLCIAGSEKAGTPVQEGVVFEKYLAALL